ncbi:MAG: Hpt domain-containing protein [Candidatus Kapabacteria bacterium]|nr:Hpt domain-containing protein [Candidatus Kapabacteria bacterium]
MKLPEDAFIRELIPEFVDDWLNNLNGEYSDILVEKDADRLYRVGHTIKGSCLQFGLDEIAQLGIRLMGHSKAGEWDEAEVLMKEIKNLFEECKIELERM